MFDANSVGVLSQEGVGFHRETFEPMPLVDQYYRVTGIEMHVITGRGCPPNHQGLTLDEFVGEQVRVELMVGTYDDGTNEFVPDPDEDPFEMTITMNADMLTPDTPGPEGSFGWAIALSLQSSVFPPGKELHVGLVWLHDFGEDCGAIGPTESTTCTESVSGWYHTFYPNTTSKRIEDIPGFTTGRVTSRVTIDLLGGEPIPAVSEWGMVVMALLTLTAGTLVYGRRGAQRGAA